MAQTTHQVPPNTQVIPKSDIETLTKAIDALGAKIDALSALATAPRTNAPANAQREMTDQDARDVLYGDLKDLKHNEAAAKLGLSYGQVYSVRGGYTFKHIWKEAQESKIEVKWKKAA